MKYMLVESGKMSLSISASFVVCSNCASVEQHMKSIANAKEKKNFFMIDVLDMFLYLFF